MKLLEFNRQKGIYRFQLEEVNTVFHAHPAIEFIFSKTGGVKIETPTASFENVFFAIINTNIKHRVIAQKDAIDLTMLEANSEFLSKILHQFDIKLRNGVYIETSTSNKIDLTESLSTLYHQELIPMTNDLRIQECLDYLNSTASDYKQMIGVLKSKTNLSESRLSHIFKEEIGISIKKYLVWSRLKKAFQLVIDQNISMYEAALQSGFYDQAHLSKAFKQMLGLKPSEVYNSRMLQA